MSQKQTKGFFKKSQNSRGQMVVEYVLLLVVVVGLASFIVSRVVSRSSDSPGFLMVKWNQILKTIGEDKPDSVE